MLTRLPPPRRSMVDSDDDEITSGMAKYRVVSVDSVAPAEVIHLKIYLVSEQVCYKCGNRRL